MTDEKFEQDDMALAEGLIEDENGNPINEEDLPEEVQKELPAWKARFRGGVYVTYIGDREYVWRTLTWGEYKEIQRQLLKLFPTDPNADVNDMESQDMDRRFANIELTVTKCLLYPKLDAATVGLVGPGVLYTLQQNIADASGFSPEFVKKL